MMQALRVLLAGTVSLAAACGPEAGDDVSGTSQAAGTPPVSSRRDNAEGHIQNEVASRICLVRVELEDNQVAKIMGLILGPDRLLVPAEGMLQVRTATVIPHCCDSRPISQIVAYDIKRNAVILQFSPSIDLPPLEIPTDQPAVGDQLSTATRLPLDLGFEGSAVALSDAVLHSDEEWSGIGRTPRFSTEESAFGYGSVVLNGQGKPVAMLTGWAGHDHDFGVWLGDLPTEQGQQPLDLTSFRADNLPAGDRSLILAWNSTTLRKDGNLQAAQAAAAESVSLDPSSWLGYYQLGVLADMMGHDLTASEIALLKSIEIEPKWVESHYSLGIIRLRQDHFGDAVEPLTRAAEIDPTYPNTLGMLGLALWKSEGPEAGLDWMMAACDAGPDRYEHLNNLRNLLSELGRETEVTTRYRAYVERNPDNAHASQVLGFLLFRTGRFAEAIPYVEAFAEREPHPRVKSLLADCLIRTGQLERARTLINEISEASPDLPELPRLRSMLEEASDN